MKQQAVAGEDLLPDGRKFKHQQHLERSEKMQVGNGGSKRKFNNQLIQQQRRKWGDWSECSKDCLRTRHRRNCDDLIQVQISTASGGLISSKGSSSINVTVASAGSGNSKRQVSELGGRTTALKDEEEEEDSLLKGGEGAINEDEDYADGGGGGGDDEEDEIDSCEKVDPSKTTEQIPCKGGLCPLSSNQHGLVPDQAHPYLQTNGKGLKTPNSRDGLGRHQRPTNNNIVEQGNPLFSNGGENEYSITGHRMRDNLASRLSDKQRQHTKQLPKSHSQNNQDSAGALSQIARARIGPANSSLVSQTIINTNGTFEGDDLTLSDSFLATSNSNNGTTTNTNSPDSAINSSFWTRTMWPKHLFDGGGKVISAPNQQLDLSQPATLIQWTILIGSLLSIVLLILLILRKLFVSTFPSYQWMLAKQTLKNTSKLNQTAAASLDCCQAASAAAAIHHQTRHSSASGAMLSPCAAVATASVSRKSPGSLFAGLKSSSTNKHQHHIHYQQQASSIPPHHMCYAWRRHQQQQPPLIETGAGVACGNGGQKHRLPSVTAHQYIVDSNGSHILNSSLGANFNTDIYDLPASFVHESANSMTNSTSTSGYNALRTTTSNQQQQPQPQNSSSNDIDHESQSVVSANYNYDTLNSSYGNQALNVVQHHQHQHVSAVEKRLHLPHSYLPQPQSSSFNPVAGQQHMEQSGQEEFNESELDSSIVGVNNYRCQQTKTNTLNEAKHGSPKVPKSQKRFDQTRFGRDLVDTKSSSTSSTISGVSGSSGGSETTSSPSIQSTTAQMLSNAASCSFEQSPDQNIDFPLTLPNNGNNTNTDTSLSSIPASSNGLNNVNYRTRNGIGNTSKLTSANTIQSQPNSPMFVNQFTNRNGSGKQSQRARHSHTNKSMSSTSHLNQRSCKDSDLSDQQQQQNELSIEQCHRQNSDISHCDANTMDDKNQPFAEDSALEDRTHDIDRRENCDTKEEKDRHFYEEIANHSQAM